MALSEISILQILGKYNLRFWMENTIYGFGRKTQFCCFVRKIRFLRCGGKIQCCGFGRKINFTETRFLCFGGKLNFTDLAKTFFTIMARKQDFTVLAGNLNFRVLTAKLNLRYWRKNLICGFGRKACFFQKAESFILLF